VTRVSQNELRLSEFDQWGEPLKNNFSHVLAENLSILLCTDNIDFFPWRRRNIPIDYQVAMEVTRLDGKLGENALLRARWTLLGGDGKKVLLKRQSSFSELTGTQDHEALVSAQSRALADLSREIAEAIKTLSR
jgi:uncharacterized lipoprotein YmbA